MAASFQDTVSRAAGFRRFVSAPHGRIEDRSNNFTALRIGFALLIVYGHAMMLPVGLPVTGAWAVVVDGAVQYALDGFFILSGYMLTASLMRGARLSDFAAARVLRIFPGLIAAVLVCWLIVGPMETALSLPDYFSRAETWFFPVAMIGQINPQAELPGVFDSHAMAAMDAPLWTIRYELACYGGAGLMAVAGLWRRARGVLVLAGVAVLWSVIEAIAPYQGPVDDSLFAAARFGGAFMVGAAFFALRDRIALGAGPVLAFAGAALVLSSTPLAMVTGQIAMAHLCMWLGFARIPGRAGGAVREVEDISFGVYILHWPAGQILMNTFEGVQTPVLFAMMAVSAILLGWLMRVGVEKPALTLRPALAGALRMLSARLRRRLAAP
jgi:peptidoglycan/LPS O-acetylase OafA/YrhL